ncbi:MAG: alpha/beta fold hydrolase [Candidatus Latescibacteria bacterium]|nr:alpha/beta fold hydrolase [Candidatus Latescibacterota bacterium]
MSNKGLLWLFGLWLGASGCADGLRPTAAEIRQILKIPQARYPLQPQLVKTWTQRDLVFEKVRFQGRYGDWIPALICYSELARSRPLPAILCMPGSPNRKEDLLQPLDLLPRWADRGFVVVSIDRPYHGQRRGDLRKQINSKGLAKVWGEYAYDLLCTLDYMQSRDEILSQRIGMLGLSMGGLETLLVTALDRRVQVAVSVAGQVDWEAIFASGAWKRLLRGVDLQQQLLEQGVAGEQAWGEFRRQYPDMEAVQARVLAPLIAPRPLLLLCGLEDPYIPPEAVRRAHRQALPWYASQRREDRLEYWLQENVGHRFTPAMQERALAWFERWL